MLDFALTTSYSSSAIECDSLPFDMDVCFFSDRKKREGIEQFIKAGYRKAFQADISVNMPALLFIEDNHLKAALGIRGHHEPFFIQQYLDRPLLSYVNEEYPSASLSEIVEIGNLYSNSNRFTIPLFLVVAVACFVLNKKYLVLSGTEHVLALIKKSGVDYQFIAAANESKLDPSSNDWGSYYSTCPKVVYVCLKDVMELIDSNEFYQKQFRRLARKVENTCNKLREVL